jgi:predicted N-acetyltransferase YhbS
MARLAVALPAQNRGVGKALLRYTFGLALEMSRRFGCVGIVVDAKADAAEFYALFGFSPIGLVEGRLESRPEPQAMFLPLELVLAALPAPDR